MLLPFDSERRINQLPQRLQEALQVKEDIRTFVAEFDQATKSDPAIKQAIIQGFHNGTFITQVVKTGRLEVTIPKGSDHWNLSREQSGTVHFTKTPSERGDFHSSLERISIYKIAASFNHPEVVGLRYLKGDRHEFEDHQDERRTIQKAKEMFSAYQK